MQEKFVFHFVLESAKMVHDLSIRGRILCLFEPKIQRNLS